jgi:2-succinyl-5-enolpyruvyl-6-hydroxy-3-cyclohexene-1-carboxylate synthase
LNVVNNGGGQIFSRIFKNSLFRNEHQLGFEAMAQFWGWNYSRVVDPNCWRPGSGLRLVEWQPCPEQSRQFWERYDQLWKT